MKIKIIKSCFLKIPHFLFFLLLSKLFFYLFYLKNRKLFFFFKTVAKHVFVFHACNKLTYSAHCIFYHHNILQTNRPVNNSPSCGSNIGRTPKRRVSVLQEQHCGDHHQNIDDSIPNQSESLPPLSRPNR